MELQFNNQNKSENVYQYEPPDSNFITLRPTLMDPYDKRFVYISNSTLGPIGDGLFAKRDIKMGEMIVTFHGTMVHLQLLTKFNRCMLLTRLDVHI